MTTIKPNPKQVFEKLTIDNSNFDQNSQLLWWIRISTIHPCYTYYFGPFDSFLEAQNHCPDYIEDLIWEKARVVKVDIDRYQPQDLTIPA